MIRPARLTSAALTACLLAGLLLVEAPRVVAQSESVHWRHGTQALRVILKNLEFKPLNSLEEIQDDPGQTVLIVLGETEVLDRIPGGLKHFLSAGGAVLVATDRRPSLSNNAASWEAELRIAVAGEPVQLAGPGSQKAYRGLEYCPIIAAEGYPAHPAFRGLERIATNRPSYLVDVTGDHEQLPVLARFPEGCQYGTHLVMLKRLPRRFAVGGERGPGRVLVLADHSVFINDMLLQDDNDNIRFTYNCLAWLARGTPRDYRVLLIEEGEVNANFDVPVIQPPIPPPGPWINDILYGAQKDDLFNRAILSQASLGKLLRGLLVVLSAGLVLYVLVRLTRARHRTESAVLSLETAVARLAPAGTGMHQRHRQMLRADNLWEAARALTRQCFEPVNGTAQAPPIGNGRPVIVVKGSWLQRRSLRRQVDRLWELAYAPRPVRVSAREFRRLPAEIEQLRTALADGRVVIKEGGDEQRR